jgi:diguanylate cyclase (GGDEF)-like protein
VTSIVAKLRQIASTDRAIADEVRRALVETLFASPTSLGAGAAAGAAVSTAIAFSTGDPWLALVAVAISLVAAARVAHAAIFHGNARSAGPESTRSEVIYETGAWAFAFLLGLLTFLTLVRTDNALLYLLAAMVTSGYSGGISGRNAGRPNVAIGQLVLASGPISVGLFMGADPLRWVLGVVNIVFMIGMVDITLQTYAAVLKAMSATEVQRSLTARFERLARYDAMTGLENRGAFQERLQDATTEALSRQQTLGVFWIDLDRFKAINDSLGHPIGDRVLCQVARQLTAIVAGQGCVARFGGDEFVMFVRGDTRSTEDISLEVLRALSLPMNLDGVSIQISSSLGLAVAPADGDSADTLLQHADLALYHAKNNGRNRHCRFLPEMKAQFLEDRTLEEALRVALERNELEVHYQPILEVKTGRITCCEALLRWNHPDLGAISPARFIPIAESTGLISAISHWVLEQACTTAAAWPDDVSVAVNMSPALLRDLHLPHMVLSTLYLSGLPARRLELEITESVLLHDDAQSNSLIRELQRIGLKLSLDDFGTGYSSLSYLRKYQFHKIKIDTSFIADVGRSKEARAIIHALVGLAGELDMEIVAEGIETGTQLDYVTGAGCTSAQGFYLGRPTSRTNIGERLANQQRGELWTRKSETRPSTGVRSLTVIHGGK